MSGLTDSGTLVRLAYQGLTNLGVDADEVLRQSGFDPEKLYQSNLRTPFSAQPRFWRAAVELSGADPRKDAVTRDIQPESQNCGWSGV